MATSTKSDYRDYVWLAIVVIFVAVLFVTVQDADTARQDYQRDYQLNLEACERSKEEYAEARIEELSKWERTDTIRESGRELSLLKSPRGFIQGSEAQVTLGFGFGPDGNVVSLIFTKNPPRRAEYRPNTIRVYMAAWPYPMQRPIDVDFIREEREHRVYLLSNDSRKAFAAWMVPEFSHASYDKRILLEFKDWLRSDSDDPAFVEFPLDNAWVELEKMHNRYR